MARGRDPEIAAFLDWCRREGIVVHGQRVRLLVTSRSHPGYNPRTCDGAQDTRAGRIYLHPKLDPRMRLSTMLHEVLHWACTVSEKVVLLLEPVVLSFVADTILKRYVPYREEIARAEARAEADSARQ